MRTTTVSAIVFAIAPTPGGRMPGYIAKASMALTIPDRGYNGTWRPVTHGSSGPSMRAATVDFGVDVTHFDPASSLVKDRHFQSRNYV